MTSYQYLNKIQSYIFDNNPNPNDKLLFENNTNLLSKLSNPDLVHLLSTVFTNVCEEHNMECSKDILSLIVENIDIFTVMQLTLDLIMLHED